MVMMEKTARRVYLDLLVLREFKESKVYRAFKEFRVLQVKLDLLV